MKRPVAMPPPAAAGAAEAAQIEAYLAAGQRWPAGMERSEIDARAHPAALNAPALTVTCQLPPGQVAASI
jgi:hypothetical protein